jgi:hypothetical protein
VSPLARPVQDLNWLITNFERVASVAHAIVVSADGLPAFSNGFPPDRVDQLAAVTSGLTSLTQGAARVFEAAVSQTVVEMGVVCCSSWRSAMDRASRSSRQPIATWAWSPMRWRARGAGGACAHPDMRADMPACFGRRAGSDWRLVVGPGRMVAAPGGQLGSPNECARQPATIRSSLSSPAHWWARAPVSASDRAMVAPLTTTRDLSVLSLSVGDLGFCRDWRSVAKYRRCSGCR